MQIFLHLTKRSYSFRDTHTDEKKLSLYILVHEITDIAIKMKDNLINEVQSLLNIGVFIFLKI